MNFFFGVSSRPIDFQSFSYQTKEEKDMTNREKLLGGVFEAALQNDMKYFG